MSKNDNQDKERRPDLSIPDQEALEEKVMEMFELEENEDDSQDSKSGDKVAIPIHEHKDEDTVLSAPELPQDEKSKVKVGKSINVVHHDDEAETEDEDETKEDKSEKADEVEEAEPPKEKILNLDEKPETKEEISGDEEAKTEDAEEAVLEKEVVENKPQLINSKPDIIPRKIDTKSKVDPLIQDEKTGRAVEDIVAKESDEILEYEDHKVKKSTAENPVKKSKVKAFFVSWWRNPKARWATVIIFISLLAAILIVPATRYKVLNKLGIRAEVSATVIDDSTGQPLKNVVVRIGSTESKTDSLGNAKLENILLGPQELVVAKRAFAEVKQDVVVGLGNNDVSRVNLTPTGVQYSFVVVDFLTKKPIEKAEVNSGESSAISDSNGKIKLTVEDSQDIDSLDLSFVKDSYRDEPVTIDTNDKVERTVELVPARKHVFVTKRDGKYDVYSVYVDGKHETKILSGTGNEREDIDLSLNPNSSVAAYVSTKSGETNADNFKLSTLSIINADTREVNDVVDMERIQLTGWIDDTLVYVQATSGDSAKKSDRHKLMTYNYKTKEKKEIMATNYFNDVAIADKKIYFAPSGALQPENAKLYRVNVNGEQKTEVAQIEIFKIFRADYGNLVLSADQNWLNLRIGEDKVTSITSPPANPVSRIYTDNNDQSNSLWVDSRDGKGVLLNYEVSSKNELSIKSGEGIVNPVYWLNNRTIVYRVSNQNESADYIVSLDGGEARKITDVTSVSTVDNWYYY